MNITDAFIENARHRPDHPAIEDGDRIVTYAELEALANGVAANLLEAGVKPGDIVALLLPDSVEHVALAWALARIGAVLFPINVRILRDEHVAGLGGDPLKFAIVLDPKVVVPSGTRALLLQTVFTTSAETSCEIPTGAGDESPLVCAQSSGTTGTPKTFQMSHSQIFTSIRSTHPRVRLTREDRYIAMIRFGFYTGWRNCFAVLASGSTMIVSRTQSIHALVQYIRDKRVTASVITPVHLRALLQVADDRLPLFPTMRALRVSTGAITKNERALARERITPNLIVGYGFNELNWVAFATPEDQDAKPDSVGRPNEGIEAEIVDDDGRPLSAGEVGLVRFRAAHAAKGYVNNPEETARAFRDGWVYPMDLAAIDEDGYIFLKGRADDRLSVDGIKFYPIEIESILKSHPLVTDAAVIGWPHSRHGQVPVAVVTSDAPPTHLSLDVFCRRHLASYKIPRHFALVSEMPRNPMGKIIKAELKDALRETLNKTFADNTSRKNV